MVKKTQKYRFRLQKRGQKGLVFTRKMWIQELENVNFESKMWKKS